LHLKSKECEKYKQRKSKLALVQEETPVALEQATRLFARNLLCKLWLREPLWIISNVSLCKSALSCKFLITRTKLPVK